MSNLGDQRLDAMRERLSTTPKRAARRVSVADDVRALREVIQTQRRAGKTWEQIAEEMYGGTKNPGAVRTAYNRLKPQGRTAARGTPPRRQGPLRTKADREGGFSRDSLGPAVTGQRAVRCNVEPGALRWRRAQIGEGMIMRLLLDLIFILVLNNSGGDGKSTWTEFLACLATFAGIEPLVIDVDPGNHGFRLRGGGGLEFGWNTSVGSGAAAQAWLEEHLGARRLVIVDTGANFLSLGAGSGGVGVDVVNTVGELAQMVAQAKGRVIVHAVTSPNKPGSAELVQSIVDRFSALFEVAVIFNDRDGSRNFGGELHGLPVESVNVPQIRPGLQAYRLSRSEPLENVLMNPTSGYAAATGALAEILRQVLEQPHVRSIVGNRADEVIRTLCAHFPGHPMMQVMTLEDARDEVLTANAHLLRDWNNFLLTPSPMPWSRERQFVVNWLTLFSEPRRERREFLAASAQLWQSYGGWEKAKYPGGSGT